MTQVFAAVKALIKEDDKFLIIKQVIGDSVFWDLPGGRVDYGESPFETLHREVKEEIHLDVEIIRCLGMWWFFRNDEKQVICTTFLCKPKHNNIDITKNPMDDETIEEFKWVTKEEFLNGSYNVSHESFRELVKSI